MAFDLSEWLNLAIRWLHLTAGIAWIGSSFYFVWLDNHLKAPAEGEASGELWSVHGGGFYHNQKYQVAPSAMPDRLGWVEWAACVTWISGVSLLARSSDGCSRSYWMGPPGGAVTPSGGIGLGVGRPALGWLGCGGRCWQPR